MCVIKLAKDAPAPKATKNAISSVEGKVLKTHLQECIKESFSGKDDSDKKITEIIKLLKR